MSEVERLKETIQKSESRVSELTETIQSVLSSFSEENKRTLEEVDKINTELEEADRRIIEYDGDISKLEQKKEGLRTETISLEQKNRDADKKVSALNSDVNSTSKELMKNQDILKQYLAKADTTRRELEKTEKSIADLQQEIDTTKEAYQKEFQERKARYEDSQRKTRELAEKEPMADFLLTEARSEPPEIAIVAKLIKQSGSASIDDLKKSTKIPPALAVKTVNSLEQKGILEKTDSNEIKLVKAY